MSVYHQDIKNYSKHLLKNTKKCAKAGWFIQLFSTWTVVSYNEWKM